MDVLKLLILLTLISVPTGEILRINITRDLGINLVDILTVATGIYGYIYLIIRKIYLDDKWKYFFCFIFIGILSLFINSSHYTQKELINSILYAARLVLLFSLLPLVTIQSKDFKMILKKILLLDGIAFILLGFAQFAFYPSLKNLMYLGWDEHYYRIFSTFLDPNFAGIFINLFLVFIIFKLVNLKKEAQIKKIVYGGLFLISTLALILTYSRTALLSVLLPAVFFIFFKNKKLIIPSLLILFASYFIFFNVGAKHQGNIGIFRTNSVAARLQSTGFAFSVIKDSPVIGIGLNGYRYYLEKKLHVDYATNSGPTHGSSPDMSLLFVYATSGIFGLIFYLKFWYEILKQKLASKDRESKAILVSILVLFIASIFINALFYVPIMVWFLIWLGVTSEVKENK